MNHRPPGTLARLAILAAVGVFTTLAHAGDGPARYSSDNAEPIPSSDAAAWRVELSPALWVTSLNGSAGVGGLTAEVDAGFSDILSKADSVFALAGRFEVGYERVGVFVDAFYADLGVTDQSGPNGRADLDFNSTITIADFGLMYRVFSWPRDNNQHFSLDAYAGGRYSDIGLEMDPGKLDSRSRSEGWIDPIVGARLMFPIAERVRASISGDVGGFGVGSQFAWSASALVGLDVHIFRQPATIFAGYRANAWDYSSGSGSDEFIWDMLLHGPVLGLQLRF